MPRTQAIAMVLAGGLFMSTVGVLLRFMEAADSFQILFYRSFGLSAIVLIMICLKRRCGPLEFVRSIGKNDLIIGLLLGLAFSFYIFSMQLTTIAVTLFLISSAPFFAAVLGWIFTNDRPGPITWISMAFAMVGVGLMVADGLNTGNLTGNLFALGSAFLFACMLIVVRKTNHEDPLGGTFLGGVVAIVINGATAVLLGTGLAVSAYDLWLCLFMGAFTIGIGIALVTWAAPHLPPAEVSILVLIESVAGPVWGWMIIGEQNSLFVLAGGIVVLIAVVVQAAFGKAPTKSQTAPPPQPEHS